MSREQAQAVAMTVENTLSKIWVGGVDVRVISENVDGATATFIMSVCSRVGNTSSIFATMVSSRPDARVLALTGPYGITCVDDTVDFAPLDVDGAWSYIVDANPDAEELGDVIADIMNDLERADGDRPRELVPDGRWV